AAPRAHDVSAAGGWAEARNTDGWRAGIRKVGRYTPDCVRHPSSRAQRLIAPDGRSAIGAGRVLHDPKHNVTHEPETPDGLYRIVLESAPDAIVGMDEQGAITDWNRQAELVFGWTKAQAIGRRLPELILPVESRDARV